MPNPASPLPEAPEPAKPLPRPKPPGWRPPPLPVFDEPPARRWRPLSRCCGKRAGQHCVACGGANIPKETDDG
jgi:hypothetical protein